MASLRKRGDTWTAEIRRKGVFKSSTFTTKAQALAWATKIEGEILAGSYGSVANKTFGQLLEDYSIKVSPTKKGARWEQVRLALVRRDPIAAIKLTELSATHFADWRDRRLLSVSASSVRRERNLLSHAVNIAISEWGWLKVNPMKGVKMPQAARARDRILSQEEIDRILYVLGYFAAILPETVGARVGAAMLYALETGMRAGEICKLTWDRVFLAQSYCVVDAGKTAAARRDVPLSPEAIRILQQLGGSTGSVFNLKTSQIDSMFRKAKKMALIEGLHFHDTRATAITRLAQKLDILPLARMVGHKKLEMLQVYYRESATDTAKKLT